MRELEQAWGHTAAATPPQQSDELPGGGGLRQLDLDAALHFRQQ